MGNNNLQQDIFRYVESLMNRNENLLMGMGALALFAAINAILLFAQASTANVTFMLCASLLLPLMYQAWVANFRRLSRFTVTTAKDYQVNKIGVVALKSADDFCAIPRHMVQEPDRPAPMNVTAEIYEMAQVYPELHNQLKKCETTHRVLTYHDAVNLLLMQEGLRTARNPECVSTLTAPIPQRISA